MNIGKHSLKEENLLRFFLGLLILVIVSLSIISFFRYPTHSRIQESIYRIFNILIDMDGVRLTSKGFSPFFTFIDGSISATIEDQNIDQWIKICGDKNEYNVPGYTQFLDGHMDYSCGTSPCIPCEKRLKGKSFGMIAINKNTHKVYLELYTD